MAEETKAPAKLPWQEEWVEKPIQAIRGAVSGMVDTVKEAVSTGKMPWEQEWKEKPRREKEYKSPPHPEPDNAFESVFKRLVGAESRGRHTTPSGELTTSPVGAEGITQLMPATAASPGYGVEPVRNKSEAEYLRFGKDYLRAMLKEFGGDYPKALAAYNYGPGAVRKAVERAGDKWLSATPRETQNYVATILNGKK